MRIKLAATTLALLVCQACQPSADVDSHIARIENELLPPLIVRGEPIEYSALSERMEYHDVPGVSIAVINDGEIEWARGYGLADVESGTPVTESTLFQAASISKPVAATAALILAERGELGLDEDVNQRMTSWQVPETHHTTSEIVTLRRLVTHSAGMTVHGFPGYARDETVPTTVEVLNGEGNTDPILPDTTPGALWRYSGGGYTVMQLLIMDVTGQPFPQVVNELVLDPIGMQLSTYEQPLPESRWSEAATGYRDDGDEVERKWHVYPEMAAAGLWTTPSDLARWAIAAQRAHAGDDAGPLSPELLAGMLRPHLNDHGLGPSIGFDRQTFGHGGANAGFRCQLIAFIEGGKGAAVMTNSDNGGAVAQEILATIASEYGWGILEPIEKTVVRLEPTVLAEIAGTYEIAGYGVIEVEVGDNHAILNLPDGDKPTLLPESETLFFDADDGTRVTFVWDEGAVVAFEVQGYTAERIN
jgi:CubicO group peptidase (beta-lactamase class C family)